MGKATQIKTETDHKFEYKSILENSSKRLDLNSLIKRNKDEAKKSRKQNIMIFSGWGSPDEIETMINTSIASYGQE